MAWYSMFYVLVLVDNVIYVGVEFHHSIKLNSKVLGMCCPVDTVAFYGNVLFINGESIENNCDSFLGVYA